MLILPILVFWAIPALILLTRDWNSFRVVAIIFAIGLVFLTGPLLLQTFWPKHSTSCAGGSCDGDMVVALFTPFFWMAVIGAWFSLAVFSMLKASSLRAGRAGEAGESGDQLPPSTP